LIYFNNGAGGHKKRRAAKKITKETPALQGFRASSVSGCNAGLGLINENFPNKVFPVAAVHEFISARNEAAATRHSKRYLLSLP